MGGGSFSSTSYVTRNVKSGTYSKSVDEIFDSREINNAMHPRGIQVRESRDSAEHPESLAIIVALDVTGSMGSIPHYLVKDGLVRMMEKIIGKGIQHPQVLFLGIGDHECDRSPLQVGQFESSDELLEKWLKTVYLEGGGGSNGGESYHLAWYFAAYHTAIDCWEKRNRKGYLFTIGDEPVLPMLPKRTLMSLMGDGQYEDFTATRLYEEACKKYHTYHVHVKETRSGSRIAVLNGWKQLLWDNFLTVERHEEIADLIASKITPLQEVISQKNQETQSQETPEEMML